MDSTERASRALAAAEAAIRYPQRMVPGLHVFTVWEFPAVGKATGFAVVRRLIGVDHSVFSFTLTGETEADGITPVLSESSASLEADWVGDRLVALKKLGEPPTARDAPECARDGKHLGVNLKGGVDLKWCCEGPMEWKKWIDWTHECLWTFRKSCGV